MRRLWAYIIASVTALILIGVGFVQVFPSSTFNMEYSSGTEMTFRVANVDENGDEIDMGNEEGAENIASVMESRLNTFGVSRYKVETQNQDTIKVTLKAESTSDLNRISTYLSFNGSLALTNAHETVLTTSTADENPSFLPKNGKAYLKTNRGYPNIVLPVDVDNEYYQAMLQETLDDLTGDKTDFGEGSDSTDDEGNTNTTYNYYFYLWFNYNDTICTFDNLKEGKQAASDRLLMKFAISEDNEFYYDDGKNNKLYSPVNIDSDGDGVSTPAEKEMGYKSARYIINLINSGELDYKVTYLYSRTVDSWSENLVSEGKIALGRTFIATAVGILVVSAILVLFYRLGALSVVTNSLLSVFAAIGFTVLFKAEFSAFAVIALVAVAVASLASGTLYLHKLKEEAYRGRSLKKANSEASRKSLLPILDINVVLMIIGAFCYIFGSSLMRSFAVITVFGGLVSLVANLIIHRLLMWLATNTTKFTGKYEVFGIDSAKVPDLVNEEKQTYYGEYAGKEFKSMKLPVTVILSVLAAASLIGGITFGAINNGQIYRQKSSVEASQIYFETTYEHSVLKEESAINKILEGTKIYLEGKEADAFTLKSVTSLVEQRDEWTEVDPEDEATTITHYTYLVTLNGDYDPDSYFASFDDGTVVIAGGNKINDLFNLYSANQLVDGKDHISLKRTVLYGDEAPIGLKVGLASLIGILVSGVYLMLRYRLSRGLSAMLLTLGLSAASWGIFSLFRLAVGNYVLGAVPVVALFSLITFIVIANREKDILADDKVKDNTAEHRQETLSKANSYILSYSLNLFILVLWIGVDFFGFSTYTTTWMFTSLVIFSALAFIVSFVLYAPLSSFFYRSMKLDNIERKSKRKKKTNKRVNKSAEPEEAVFIGIND